MHIRTLRIDFFLLLALTHVAHPPVRHVEAAKFSQKNYAGTFAAVKICPIQLLRFKVDETSHKKEAVEVKVWEKLDHPNVVKLYCHYMDAKYVYLIQECMLGGELFDTIVAQADIGYSERWARGVAKDILEGLNYLHENDIIHRDIKPENLLLDRKPSSGDYKVKVADFGYADILTPDRQKLRQRYGTPGYCAPEILQSKPYGREVDMWSFGCILYILLVGYPPFDHEDDANGMKCSIAGEYEFLDEDWKDINASAIDLIRQCLNLNQKTRITAKQALSHQWMLAEKRHLSDMHRTKSYSHLKKYVAKRRWRRAMNAVRFSIRASRLSRKSREEKEKSPAVKVDPDTEAALSVLDKEGGGETRDAAATVSEGKKRQSRVYFTQ